MHIVVIADKHHSINATYQKEKGSMVEEIPNKEANSHQSSATSYQHSQTKNLDNDMIDPNRLELEGTREEGRNRISNAQFPQTLKIKHVHIGSSKNPNLTNVQNYLHTEAVSKIVDLL